MSAADSNTSLPEKKSGYTFGHSETLLLISLYQKYEVFSVMFRTRKRQDQDRASQRAFFYADNSSKGGPDGRFPGF